MNSRADHDGFEAFYQDVRGRLLLQTWALTADLAAAQKAVRDALVVTWHHWRKVRPMDDTAREDWVRPIAWGRALRRHSVPHLHKDQALPPDVRETLVALRSLSHDERKIFLLGHLTSVTLGELAREVGIPQGRTEAELQHANAVLCEAKGVAPNDLNSIFAPLAEISAEQPWPRAGVITRSGSIRRRAHTAGGAIAAVAALVGAGFFVSQSDDTAEPRLSSLSMQSAEQAFENQPSQVPGKKMSSKDLLSNAEVAKVLGGKWSVDITSDNLEGTPLRITCQQGTTADPHPVSSFARTFVGTGKRLTAGTAVESSVDDKAAAAAYQKMLKWYAACAEPRYQLVSTEQVKSLGDEATIFGFRDFNSPERGVMFGVSRTGRHTAAVTLMADGTSKGLATRTSTLLGTAVQHLCALPGRGACVDTNRPRTAIAPLRVAPAPGLLNQADLPRASGVSNAWEATEAKKPTVNSAATRCDNTSFSKVSGALTRSFLVPDAQGLDPTFGLTETVGTFPTTALATGFTSGIRKALDACGDKELGSHVSQLSLHATKSESIGVWSVRVELNQDKSILYLMAVVRDGNKVAQIGFVPDGSKTISHTSYIALAQRAAERLAYL